MLKSRSFWYVMMAGAVAGWVFAIKGLVQPFEGQVVKKASKDVLLGWALGHPLELVLAVPIGRAAGLSFGRIFAKTMLFGFTWWLPLFLKVFRR